MKNLDKTRLLNLLRWDLTTYRKEYRNIFLWPFGALMGFALLKSGYILSWGNEWGITQAMAWEGNVLASLMVMFAMVGVMGNAFTHLNLNQDRISYFMLPASNLEKYLVRVLFRGLIMFAEVILAVLVTDVLFGLLCWLRTGEFFNGIDMGIFFNDILGTGQTSLLDWCEAALGVILIWSFFLVGSAFFRRRPVLMTFMVCLGAVMALSAIVAFSAGFLEAWIADMKYDKTQIVSILKTLEPMVEPTGIAILLLWIAGNVWWSYRIFTRMQAINGRWNNLKK